MKPNDLQPAFGWRLARRAERMNPSVIREILKVTERPGIISFAGGLPSPRTFPVGAFAEACAKVLRDDGAGALQYAASEGYGPLREAVAAMLPWPVDPAQVLITTGSQQGLDLVAKVLVDQGSRVLVETPTYLGALQAFAPMEPEIVGVARTDILGHAWCDNGPPWRGVLLGSAAQVLALKPDASVLAGLDVGVVAALPADAECAFEVRAFFAGSNGLAEDPVTGSLNAALAQWLIGAGLAPHRYVASQGSALGRAGRVHVERDAAGATWIGGDSVTCIDGTVRI
jgi:hypothetical protein